MKIKSSLSAPLSVAAMLLLFWIDPIKIIRDLYKDSRYGTRLNQERIKLGILPLPENWATKGFSFNGQNWHPPNQKELRQLSDTSYRSEKRILVSNDTLVYEEDEISRPVAVDRALSLILRYYYVDKKWEYSYATSISNGHMGISKVQADSIIKAWGTKLW